MMAAEWFQFWGAVVGVLLAGLRYSYQMDKVIGKMEAIQGSLAKIEGDFSSIVERVVSLEQSWERAFPRSEA